MTSVRAQCITWTSNGWKGISDEQIATWQAKYPNAVVRVELFRMAGWLRCHERRRPKNWQPFISNWLSRVPAVASNSKAPQRRAATYALTPEQMPETIVFE
jgi:hypothetical protein